MHNSDINMERMLLEDSRSHAFWTAEAKSSANGCRILGKGGQGVGFTWINGTWL